MELNFRLQKITALEQPQGLPDQSSFGWETLLTALKQGGCCRADMQKLFFVLFDPEVLLTLPKNEMLRGIL
jgi:hypothetical protein